MREASDTGELRVLYAVSSEITAEFHLREHLTFMAMQPGLRVWLLVGRNRASKPISIPGVSVIQVPLKREIAPFADILGLLRILREIRLVSPHVVNAATPKAGLLVVLASWMLRVPVRIYTVLGLRFETERLGKRQTLMLCERFACWAATTVLCVSKGVREKLITANLVQPERTSIIANGSYNGVNVDQFAPNQANLLAADQKRRELEIPIGSRVIGYVGRLTRDKGIDELVRAYSLIRRDDSRAILLLVGDFEPGDPVSSDTIRKIRTCPGIVRCGFTDCKPAAYYHLMSVLVLPTYREGFPNVVLEAGAAGKPVVATRVTGVVDAVIDGVTGLLVSSGDAAALAAAIRKVLDDKALAGRLGLAGYRRVVRDFSPEGIWWPLLELYRSLDACRHAAPESIPRRQTHRQDFRTGADRVSRQGP